MSGSRNVLDPFCGSGTVGVVAPKHRRNFIVIDLNSEYCEMARRRIAKPDQIYLLLEFTIERSAADTSLPHPTSQRQEPMAAATKRGGIL